MRGSRDRTAQLGRFLVALQQGRPREEAFRESFQTDYTTLLAEVRKYMAGGRFPYSVTKFSDLKIPRETRTERIDHAEALALLGSVLGRCSRESWPDAEAYFRAALAENSGCAAALSGLGELEMWRGRLAEAIEDLHRAVQAGSVGYRAYFSYGLALLLDLQARPVSVAGLAPEHRRLLEEARASLSKSLELEPGFAEARAALGRSYFFEDGEQVAPGIAALEEAVRLLPSRTDLARDLALLRERRRGPDKGN